MVKGGSIGVKGEREVSIPDKHSTGDLASHPHISPVFPAPLVCGARDELWKRRRGRCGSPWRGFEGGLAPRRSPAQQVTR